MGYISEEGFIGFLKKIVLFQLTNQQYVINVVKRSYLPTNWKNTWPCTQMIGLSSVKSVWKRNYLIFLKIWLLIKIKYTAKFFCRFKTASILRRHARIHQDFKAYACDVCGHRTLDKGGLKQHIIRYHTENSPFPCDICGKKFYSARTMNVRNIDFHDVHHFNFG